MEKIIYNCSFMMERSLRTQFEDWFREKASVKLCGAGGSDSNAGSHPRLTLLADVPDNPDFSDEALTYAYQLEFPDIESARRWGRECLGSVRAEYEGMFGRERALSFDSILREVPLKQ